MERSERRDYQKEKTRSKHPTNGVKRVRFDLTGRPPRVEKNDIPVKRSILKRKEGDRSQAILETPTKETTRQAPGQELTLSTGPPPGFEQVEVKKSRSSTPIMQNTILYTNDRYNGWPTNKLGNDPPLATIVGLFVGIQEGISSTEFERGISAHLRNPEANALIERQLMMMDEEEDSSVPNAQNPKDFIKGMVRSRKGTASN